MSLEKRYSARKMFNLDGRLKDKMPTSISSIYYINTIHNSDPSQTVHEILVNCLFKLAQEKVWLGQLTVPQ